MNADQKDLQQCQLESLYPFIFLIRVYPKIRGKLI